MKISTQLTSTNIEKILELLAETPDILQELSRSRSVVELSAPLLSDGWSFAEVLAHLNACAELITHATYYALLVENPTLPDVHPQRNWAKLVRYDQFSFTDLLASFKFQREVLLSRLNELSETQWNRPISRAGKRQENIYRLGRSLALHEFDHLVQLEAILV